MPLPTPEVIEVDGVGRLVICRQPTLAPTLLFFALDAETSVLSYSSIVPAMYDRGWTVGSIDMPGHGLDVREGETGTGLQIWAARVATDEHIVQTWNSRLARLIDLYLIPNGISEAGRIALGGGSRGAFMALHGAAVISAVKAVAGIIPVTDLAALSEFDGLHDNWIVKATAIRHLLLERKPVFLRPSRNDTRVSSVRCFQHACAIKERAGDALDVMDFEEGKVVTPADNHTPAPGTEAEAADWLSSVIT